MVNVSREMCERNDVETIIDNGEIFRLNEKHLEERIYYKYLQMTTGKYFFRP